MNEDAMPKAAVLGTWRLVSGEVQDSHGVVAVKLVDGLLHYAPSGHMSVQIIVSPTDVGVDVQRAVGDFIAYFGTYTLSDEDERRTVTHHIEGGYGNYSTRRTLVRYYRVEGDELRLSVDMAQSDDVARGTRGALIWKRCT